MHIYIYTYIHQIYSIYCCAISKKNSTNLVRPNLLQTYFRESFSGEYHERENNKSPLL